MDELTDRVTDGTHYTPKYVDDGVAFISVKDVREDEISFADTKFISQEEHEVFTRRCNPLPGDILLTKVGTIGLAAVVPTEAPIFDLFVSVCLIKPISSKVIPEFLCTVLNSDIARIQFSRALKGIGVPDLHLENIRKTLIPLPPLNIQTQLVQEMQDARAARSAKLKEADEALSGIDAFLLNELGLTLPKHEKRTAYAVSLKQVRGYRYDPHFFAPEFDALAKTIQSQSSARLGNFVVFSQEQWNPSLEQSETFRYIEISGVNIRTGEAQANETLVVEAPSRARMRVREGDLIVSTTRPHHGAIALIDSSLDDCIASTGFAVIRSLLREDVLPVYLWCILRSRLCLRQMLQRSSGGNYPAITESELCNVRVPIPSLETQERIVDEVARRKVRAQMLREQAEADWQAAKARFEAKLLE